MSLFAPSNLLWLLPVFGTLLLLYFLRPRRRSQQVPSLFLWNAVTRSSRSDTPFQKLKLTLLFILQVLALLALIFALALPFTKPRPTAKSVYEIVIDQSASMEATDVSPSRFEQAKAAAIQFVQSSVKDNDSAYVVEAGAGPTLVCPPTADTGRLVSAINKLQPQDVSADIASALSFGRSAERAATTVILFTDGNWDSSEDGDLLNRAGAPMRVEIFSTPEPINAGITALSERSNPALPDSAPQILVAVDQHNTSGGNLDISLNGTRVATAKLPGGSSRFVKVFSLAPLRRGGLVTAKLSGVAGDTLAVDNTSSLIVPPNNAERVLLVTDGNPYIERALALIPNVQLYEVTPAQYSSSAGNFDLVVFDRWLPQTLSPGAYLVFDAVNANMPVTPAGQLLSGQQIVDWDETDPLLNFTDLSTVRVQTAQNVQSALWGRIVAEFGQGPAIVKGEKPGQSIVWVGFEPSESNLPLLVAFPIFLSNAVQTLATGNASVTAGINTGSPILLKPIDGTWNITAPNGDVSGIHCTSSSPCEFIDTDLAGVYTARAGTTEQSFAVNLDSRAETDTAAKPHPMLSSVSATSVTRPLQRLNLVPWIAAAALAIILIEWLAYNRPVRYTRPV